MTSGMDTPLLALLGKGGLPAGGDAPAGDERALEAAMEFAALLLDAGAVAADGKTLPEPAGNILPLENADAVPVAVVEDISGEPIAAPVPATPEGDAADTLGGELAATIRNARAQPAVLQRNGGRAPGRQAATVATAAAQDAPPAERGTTRPAPPVTPPPAAPPDAIASTAVVTARLDSLRNGVAGARRSTDGAAAARVEGLAAGLAPLSRDAAAATTAAAVPQLAGPDVVPGDGEWGRQFAERVGWVIQARVPQAQITLNPEHLGPIEMAVEVEDAKARVQFAAAHAMTREAIEQSLPRLREMLGQQGLELTQADVGGGQSAPRDGHATGDGDTPALPAATESSADDAPGDAEAAGTATGPVLRARGLVDTFV